MPGSPSIVDHPNKELIASHCADLIITINQHHAYYPSDLYKIASLIAYGMHRPKVWSFDPQSNGKGYFSVTSIDKNSIDKQADLVFAGLKIAHMLICQNINLKGKSKDLKEHSINMVLKDLMDKIAAVIVQKQIHQSGRHERSTCEQLTQADLNVEDPLIREKTLALIYKTELDDQRYVFQSVLSKYNTFLSLYNEKGKRSQFVRSQTDFLLNHREITCRELINFNLKDRGQHNNTCLKRYFFDFLRDRLPNNKTQTIQLTNVTQQTSFDRCISRPQPPLISTSASPTSVTKVDEPQVYDYGHYSLFGENKLIDDETLRWIREGCTGSNSI